MLSPAVTEKSLRSVDLTLRIPLIVLLARSNQHRMVTDSNAPYATLGWNDFVESTSGRTAKQNVPTRVER